MADITIGELTRAENVAAEDLFVLEKESVAYSLTGDTLKDFLLELADSLGGISSISKTSTSGLVDTYTITYSRTGETSTFNVTNGTSERIYIKYAEDRPVTDAEMSDEPNNWIGIYTGQAAPSSFRDYAWFQFKGNQGDKGDDGNIPIIEAGNTETLPSGSDATFNVEPTSVGYRLNVGIPRGVDGTGAGTVTSVGITAGSGISIEGSPVTSAGSIIVGHSNELDPQNAEKIFKFAYDANGHVTSSSALEVGKDFGALSFKVTLFANAWSNNRQTVNDVRFVADGYSFVVSPEASSKDNYSSSSIFAEDVTANASMVFSCKKIPSENITVNVIRMVSA